MDIVANDLQTQFDFLLHKSQKVIKMCLFSYLGDIEDACKIRDERIRSFMTGLGCLECN